MLGNYPINPVLLAKDLGAARQFYHIKLGLEIISENENDIVFRSGGGRLEISKSTIGTADTQTQATWFVENLQAEVADLRSRGINVENYDLPDLKTEGGIADFGFALAAWFVDPGKNVLGIVQLKK
jgi:hypothetical protein